MILQPNTYTFYVVSFGFLVVTPLIISLAICFEKLDQDLYTFTGSTIPIIILCSILLSLTIFSSIVFLKDVLKNGCMAWDRDSFGEQA